MTIDVMGVLPHRYPFLLVDTLDLTVAGREAVGTKRVTGSEWFAEASGEQAVTMPNLMVVEALAQTSAALLADLAKDTPGAIGYFAAIKRVRFRGSVRAGDLLTLTVNLQSFKRGIAHLNGVATVDGLACVKAEFTTVIRQR
jgi:3-hydroxymyristoyl/3-hydroxydecanoyl-(acyl carrier protein) dehydratases